MTREEAIRHIRTVFTKDLADEIILALEDKSVLEDIKAELTEMACCAMNDRFEQGIRQSIKVVDNHISGKEQAGERR